MKISNLFVGIGLMILSIGHSHAQNWAPVGAKWTYTLTFAFSPDVDTLVVRSVGDTIIQGKQCRKLHKSMIVCDLRGADEYMYADNGRVCFYDASREEFQMLFDMNAQVGDTWSWRTGNLPFQDSVVVKVDSISTMLINSINYKELFVKYLNAASPWYTTGSGRIIENIGDDYYLFPWVFGACDGSFGGPLRCYDDNFMGHYETGVVSDCNYRSVGIHENSALKPRISIFPNPAKDEVFVELKETGESWCKTEIFNLLGTKLASGTYPAQNYSLDIKKFPAGLYILSVNVGGMACNYKLFIEKE
ncbi:MAG: T9SS type A sorting domain-containing protein [Bacteroidales bacterium]